MSRNPTVLVIDDQEKMRDACQKIVKKNGYRAETSTEWADGLLKIRKLNPDLVMVDLRIPGISGIEVLEKIRNIELSVYEKSYNRTIQYSYGTSFRCSKDSKQYATDNNNRR